MKGKLVDLTAEQLADILSISEYTVKKLAKEKDLPCVYVNGKPKFDLYKILAYFRKLERGAV